MSAPHPQVDLRTKLQQIHLHAGLADRINRTRPKKMSEKLAEPIGVRLTPALKLKLERIAAANGFNAVDVMRSLAEEYVEKYEANYRALKSIFDHSDD